MPRNDPAREERLRRLEEAGVRIPLWDGILIEPTVRIEPGATILPGCILRGSTTVGADAVIGPRSVLTDAVIGAECSIRESYVTSSVIGEKVTIGPFSRIRPGCRISRECRIGDFVEVKNSLIGERTAIAHLTYVGDTDCGDRVNFGCGVAVANYDGRKKHRTKIGNDAFIGCNTNLVAPVQVGDGAYTAAGTTVTRDVPENAMVIARPEEVIRPGLAVRFRRDGETRPEDRLSGKHLQGDGQS